MRLVSLPARARLQRGHLLRSLCFPHGNVRTFVKAGVGLFVWANFWLSSAVCLRQPRAALAVPGVGQGLTLSGVTPPISLFFSRLL